MAIPIIGRAAGLLTGVGRPALGWALKVGSFAGKRFGPIAVVAGTGEGLVAVSKGDGEGVAKAVGGTAGAISFGAAGTAVGGAIGGIIGGFFGGIGAVPGAAAGATIGSLVGSTAGYFMGRVAGRNVAGFVGVGGAAQGTSQEVAAAAVGGGEAPGTGLNAGPDVGPDATPATTPQALERSDEVRRMQAMLYILGSDYAATLNVRGGIDGVRGRQTDAALAAYAQARGVDVNDRAGMISKMQEDLAEMSPEDLQARLTEMNADGLSDRAASAVRAALRENNIEVGVAADTSAEIVGGDLTATDLQEEIMPPVATDISAEELFAQEQAEIFAQNGTLVLMDDRQNGDLRGALREVMNNGNEIDAANGSFGILFVHDDRLYFTNADGSEVRQIDPTKFNIENFQLDKGLNAEIHGRLSEGFRNQRLLPQQFGENKSVTIDGVKFNVQAIGRDGESPRMDVSLNHAEYKKYHSGMEVVGLAEGRMAEQRDVLKAVENLRGRHGDAVRFEGGMSIDFRGLENQLRSAVDSRKPLAAGGASGLNQLFSTYAQGAGGVDRLSQAVVQELDRNKNLRQATVAPGTPANGGQG